MNIFVGNLSFQAKEADVYKAFLAFGAVASVAIVMDKNGKKSRGFGFVEMPNDPEAIAAIAGLHGIELMGRPINVMPAVSKKPKIELAEKKSKLDFKRTGEYRRGRRTRSFMLRRAESGISGPLPERKYKDNPMRWRKKQEQPKPRQKPRQDSNPGGKPEEGPKPWQKRRGASQPWEKTRGPRPWKKNERKKR